jgi:hypothetical protein
MRESTAESRSQLVLEAEQNAEHVGVKGGGAAKTNESPVLKVLLSRVQELIGRASDAGASSTGVRNERRNASEGTQHP